MSNISNLEFWVDMANLGVAVALALSFIFGGASLYLSRKLGKVKDSQSAQEKAVSDEKIATANAEAAKALGGLSESNERIAGLNKEAEALRAEAENAKAERAEADKQIAIAKVNAARADEGSAKATAEVARLQIVVANAEAKRAEAEQALLKLQQRVHPRSLTAEQRAIVVSRLRKLHGQTVILTRLRVEEVELYAKQIEQILREADWNVIINVMESRTPLLYELHIRETNPTLQSPAALALIAAFSEAGLMYSVSQKDQPPRGPISARLKAPPAATPPADFVELFVGLRSVQ